MKCLQCKKTATKIEDELRECEDGHRTGKVRMPRAEFKKWKALKRCAPSMRKHRLEAGGLFHMPVATMETFEGQEAGA